MNISIQTFIEMCQWDQARFLIFSDNVFGTLIYYSHFLALVLALVVGVFVFLRGKHLLTNWLLASIMFSFSLWVFLDLILWANEKDYLIMFFWSMILVVEPLIYALCVYFIDVFIEKKDVTFKKKVGIFSLLLPIIVLLPTKWVLNGFDLTNCNREPVEGFIATYYIYITEIIYVFWILFFVFKKYRQSSAELKKQIVLITMGVVLFLLSFVSGNIIGSITENWTIAQIGIFSMPIFTVFLAFMIVKFKTFNIKLIWAEVLVFVLGFLVLAILFIRDIVDVRKVVVFTLVFVAGLGYALIKSVKKEVEQKEELAKLNINLEELLKQRESLVHLVTHKVKGSFTRSKYIFAGILDGTFGDVNDEIKKRAKQGLESDNGGIDTVDLVLNAANLQKGTVKYEMKNVDFKELVEKVLLEKKVYIEAKGLKLETEIIDGKFIVLGDSLWLKEVINNLLDNAIKYTREGEIKIGLSKGDNKVLFYVQDTGIGINSDDEKILFTEGGRGKDSVRINVDSTGYGLYSVKLIVDAHKGKVWMKSLGENKGTTFFVELEEVVS